MDRETRYRMLSLGAVSDSASTLRGTAWTEPPVSLVLSPEPELCRSRRRSPLLLSQERVMTTAELIAKLKSDDPHGVREVVIWESDEELTRGVERVVLRDDRVVVITSRQH